MSDAERPLVTLVLVSYNQEKFIHEAVGSVLRQSYSPLQIIISDDASTDRTASILAEEADSYRGPHTVSINKNESNLGLAEHINRVVGMADGELIMLAAGDDISDVDRVEIMVREWIRLGRPPAICSDFVLIDEDGAEIEDYPVGRINFDKRVGETQYEVLKRFVRTGTPSLIGCTEAWRRDLVICFPPLLKDVWFEDKAYSFRAWLLGEIAFLKNKLVRYRVHGANISLRSASSHQTTKAVADDELARVVQFRRMLALLKNHEQDLDHAFKSGFICELRYQECKKLLAEEIQIYGLRSSWWTKSIVMRLISAVAMVSRRPALSTLVWAIPRILPLQGYASLKAGAFRLIKSS